MKLGEIWKSYTRLVRLLIGALLLSGVVLASIGFIGDLLGWWDSVSYAPNLMTSATGACFGLPLALIGLTAVTDQRSRRQETERVESLSDGAWRNFENAVTAYCPKEVVDSILEDGGTAVELVGRAKSLLQQQVSEYNDQLDPQGRGQISTEFCERCETTRLLIIQIGDQLYEVNERIKSVLGSLSHTDLQWSRLRNSWRFVNHDVRIARLGLGLQWIDSEQESILQMRIVEGVNEVAPIVNDLWRLNYSRYPTGTGSVPGFLRSISSGSGIEMVRQISGMGSGMSWGWGENLSGQITRAAFSLNAIRNATLEVSESGVLDR